MEGFKESAKANPNLWKQVGHIINGLEGQVSDLKTQLNEAISK